MMRAAEATGAYKRFLGSSFLSDFTLIICCESAVEEPSSSDLTATPSLQHSGATAGEQEPGTPDNGLSPKSAAAAAGRAQSLVGAAADAAPAQADASADAPCSGQHHPDLPDILQHSPHHAAPALGAVCSPRLLQGTAMPAQRPGFADPPAATAAGPGSAVGSSPSSLLTVSSTAAAAAAAAAAASTSAGSGNRHSAAPNSLAGADTLLTVPAPSPDSKAAAAGGSGGSVSAISKLQEASRTSSCSSSSTAIVMPVHGVVLAAASPYFETLLRGWASSHQPLHMVVGEDQLQAAQQLLAFIYIGSLQPGLQQADLLQLLLLADRFDVSRAVAAARRALATLGPECFEWPTLTGVWSLPPHLFECEGDEAAALRGVAWERLLQLFGDLEEAWSTADGRAMWQQLPWRAVSALVASDALAVASENTTFAAVSSWIAHQQHQQQLLQERQGGSNLSSQNPPGPTPQELQLLAASIRIPSLGPCYLSYVSLQQDWFASAVDVTSLARAAAFAAAAPEVRKDLIDFTATTTAAAMQAAAAAPSRHGCCHSGSNAGTNDSLAAPAIAGSDCIGSSLGPWGAAGVAGYSKGSSCGGCHCGASMAAVGCGSSGGCSGSNGIEHKAQLLALAQAMQRPRALSSKRAGQFGWRVDIAAIRQLYDDVAAAGSRDSRILRSPAHSFAGYEWALQLEVTQTRGATGFDVSKPWSLGVFLTCQVRLEQPAHSSRAEHRSQQSLSPVAGAAGVATPTEAAGAGAAAGDVTRRFSSSSGSSGYFGNTGSDGAGKGAGKSGAAAAAGGIGQQHQLVMQLFDFGFVSTSATIAVREAGAANKRTEKSWEHAVVRYRASWGWPNYLDAQAVGWDESLFSRWLIDGQLHLSARVRVLG